MVTITKIPRRTNKELSKVYHNMDDFFPYYLQEHSNVVNRRLHVIGTTLALLTLIYILLTGSLSLLYLPIVIGYGFAWVGHFFFERNKPATFKYPLLSFKSDWKLLYLTYTGQLKF